MNLKYVTKDGDTLDSICFDFYGDSRMLEAVYNANPGIELQPAVLSAGITIELPEQTSTDGVEAGTVRLWD